MLWSAGIYHVDISDDNLMWDPATQKPKLCDFGFAEFHDSSWPGEETKESDGSIDEPPITGTAMFLPTDLLFPRPRYRLRKPLFRQEVEAFGAVLVWIACRYVNGKLRIPPPLQEWKQADLFALEGYKKATFTGILNGSFLQPPGVPTGLWDTIISTILDLMKLKLDAEQAETDQYRRTWDVKYARRCPPKDPNDYNTLRVLQKILEWQLFRQPYARHYAKLIKKRIPEASDTQRRTFGFSLVWDYIRPWFS